MNGKTTTILSVALLTSSLTVSMSSFGEDKPVQKPLGQWTAQQNMTFVDNYVEKNPDRDIATEARNRGLVDQAMASQPFTERLDRTENQARYLDRMTDAGVVDLLVQENNRPAAVAAATPTPSASPTWGEWLFGGKATPTASSTPTPTPTATPTPADLADKAQNEINAVDPTPTPAAVVQQAPAIILPVSTDLTPTSPPVDVADKAEQAITAAPTPSPTSEGGAGGGNPGAGGDTGGSSSGENGNTGDNGAGGDEPGAGGDTGGSSSGGNGNTGSGGAGEDNPGAGGGSGSNGTGGDDTGSDQTEDNDGTGGSAGKKSNTGSGGAGEDNPRTDGAGGGSGNELPTLPEDKEKLGLTEDTAAKLLANRDPKEIMSILSSDPNVQAIMAHISARIKEARSDIVAGINIDDNATLIRRLNSLLDTQINSMFTRSVDTRMVNNLNERAGMHDGIKTHYTNLRTITSKPPLKSNQTEATANDLSDVTEMLNALNARKLTTSNKAKIREYEARLLNLANKKRVDVGSAMPDFKDSDELRSKTGASRSRAQDYTKRTTALKTTRNEAAVLLEKSAKAMHNRVARYQMLLDQFKAHSDKIVNSANGTNYGPNDSMDDILTANSAQAPIDVAAWLANFEVNK